MTGFDFVLLAILAISALLGLIRGLLKEVLSLVAYVSAFIAAIWWGPTASDMIEAWISQSFLRMAVAYFSVFIVVLLSIGLVNMTLAALISKTGLTPADHGLGALFGLVRGMVFILLLVTIAGFTALPNEVWWKQAMFSKQVVSVVQQIKQRLPVPLGQWLPY